MDELIERYDKDPSKKKRQDKRSGWIFLGIIAIVIKVLSSQNPFLIEELYHNTIFRYIRLFLDNTIGRLNFPVLYIIIPFLLLKILGVYWNGIRVKGGCIVRILNFLYSTLASFMWIVFWFTLLWGLNYNRISIAERLGITEETISNERLFQEMNERVDDLIQRRSFKEQETSFSDNDLPINLENIVRDDVLETMELLGFNPKGNVRIRNLSPKGILLRFGTAGFYFPFSGECNIDSGLHPLQKPFTMAHEMAHGYGVGSESNCNFIAYLACIRSENDFIKYSGELAFWRYIASSYKISNRDAYQNYRENLDKSLVLDLDDIHKNNLKYPDFMPNLRNNAYDTYLKSQGEQDGIASYGKVVELVFYFESQQKDHPIFVK